MGCQNALFPLYLSLAGGGGGGGGWLELSEGARRRRRRSEEACVALLPPPPVRRVPPPLLPPPQKEKVPCKFRGGGGGGGAFPEKGRQPWGGNGLRQAGREREKGAFLPSFLPLPLPFSPALPLCSSLLGGHSPSPQNPPSLLPPLSLTHSLSLSSAVGEVTSCAPPPFLPCPLSLLVSLASSSSADRRSLIHFFLSRRPRPGTAPAKRTSDSRPAHLNAHTCLKGKKACADRVEARKRPTVARIRDRRERKNKFTKLASGGNRSKEKEEGSDLGVRGSAGEKEEERGKR